MRFIRIISFVGCALLFTTMSASGQSISDYLERYEYSYFGLEFTSIETTSTISGSSNTRTFNSGGIAATLGIYLPVVEFSEAMSVGVNPDVNIVLRVFGDTDEGIGTFLINFPLMAAVKYGTDATIVPQSTFGFGAGIGYQPWLLVDGNLDESISQIIGMGEISFVINDQLWKLRALLPISGSDITEFTTFSSINLSLLYLPGVGG